MKPTVQPGVAEPEALLWQPVVAVPQAGSTEGVRPGEADGNIFVRTASRGRQSPALGALGDRLQVRNDVAA
jgi:hypothetical protein